MPAGLSLEDYSKNKLEIFFGQDSNLKLPEYYKNYIEFLADMISEEYILIHNKLYYISYDNEIETDDDIYEATLNEDGSIDYEVKFYNGACGFSEAIEEAVDNIKTDDEKIESDLLKSCKDLLEQLAVYRSGWLGDDEDGNTLWRDRIGLEADMKQAYAAIKKATIK